MSATTHFVPLQITKRDGRLEKFDDSKIFHAIEKAVQSANTHTSTSEISEIVSNVVSNMKHLTSKTPNIEEIQDLVEKALMTFKEFSVAKSYVLYREERSKIRLSESRLMQTFNSLTSRDAKDMDLKRENANVDGNSSMGLMLKFGSEGSTEFTKLMLMKPEHATAHEDRRIHVHDLDFYAIGTTTCCQIDLIDMFTRTFSTGHGSIREPNDISTYAALACIVLQSNQNEQHGGQSIPNFDYAMAEGVKKSYYTCVCETVTNLLQMKYAIFEEQMKKVLENQKESLRYLKTDWVGLSEVIRQRYHVDLTEEDAKNIETVANRMLERKTFQAMEALIHNLNTMHSRAGSQVPFTSINFGTDVSDEGRLATRSVLKATWNGLGNGETAIFPISVFKVMEGVNYNPEDTNYDLFKLAIKVSAKRLFPNFVFLDAPFNKKYYKKGDYRTEAVAMGCRTRVIGSIFPESDGIVTGRGNLSFTTINLPRLGIKYGICEGKREVCELENFYKELKETMDLVTDQLIERYRFQCNKKVMNFPFMMGQGVWYGSKELKESDTLESVLKHGTLSIGFIGLAETLVALTGKHHGESNDSWGLGKRIIQFMRDYCDETSKTHHLNFSLLGTPAEGLSGRFVKYDAEVFGKIKGVTDRDYYTNSFHVPVYFKITAADKIRKEAPFHEMCNAGHITYVEVDGDPLKNLGAFEQIVRIMKESGIGYGSINHPVDRDPKCGYVGIIDNVCPKCHRKDEDHDCKFERLRRITGYLVGTLDRWNNAKQAEEKDRVKHA